MNWALWVWPKLKGEEHHRVQLSSNGKTIIMDGYMDKPEIRDMADRLEATIHKPKGGVRGL